MSFFKQGESWLKDALNKVESQLDKAFEIPKETASSTTIKRSYSHDSTGDSSSNMTIGVAKSTSRLISDNTSIPSLSPSRHGSSPKSKPLASSSSSPTISSKPRSPSFRASACGELDPADVPLPPDSPALPPIAPVQSSPIQSSKDPPLVGPNLLPETEKELLAMVSMKDEQIRSMLLENEHVQSDLARARETIKKLLLKAKMSEDKLREQEKAKESLSAIQIEDLEALKKEVDYWKTQTRELIETQQADSDLVQEAEPYRIALETELKKFVQLQASFESTKQELASCRFQLDRTQAQLTMKESEYQATVVQLEAEVDRYRSQALDSQVKFESTFQRTTLALTKQLQQTESNLKSSEEALIEREEQMASQLENSKRESLKLESSLEKMRSEHSLQLESYHELDRRYTELQEGYEQLQCVNNDLRHKLKTLTLEAQHKSSSEEMIAEASQTDLSFLSADFPMLDFPESTLNTRADSDTFSSKEGSQKLSDQQKYDSTASLASRKVSMDTVPNSPFLTSALRTQLAVLQTAKEQLTLQVVQFTNENTSLKAQLDEMVKENHQLNDNYQTVLELLGEKEEEIADCRLTLKEAKEAYREQLEMLMTSTQKD